MAAISQLVPAAAAIGGPGFTLTVVGTGFVAGDAIWFNNSPEATAFVSDTQLSTTVKAFMSTTPGDYPVKVVSDGVDSNELSFSFTPVDTSHGSLLLQQLINVVTPDGTRAALAAATDAEIATIRREWQDHAAPEVLGQRYHFVETRDAIIAEMARREIAY